MKISIRALILSLICIFSIPAMAGAIDINTATAEQLAETMKGVGPAKAQEIIIYRNEHGSFESIDQLVEVKGIGAATVDKNRGLVTVSGTTPLQSADK